MAELDDHALLQEFARNGSEAAFTTLVERYVSLVYSTALRSTSNAQDAKDITQAVFVILAQKAAKLSSRVILSGWLYQTARLTAANFHKREYRRQRREQEAHMQSTLNEQDTAAWEQIAPFLDEAMGHLGQTDRNAVVLRFFENKTAREVGKALQLSEAATHKRVNRALDKLRKLFSKRGITLSATLIAGAVSTGSVQAAPAGLVSSIAGAAVTGSAISATTLTLVKGVLNLMAWTKAKTAIAAGVAIALVGGTTTVAVKEISRAKAANALQGAWQGTLNVPQANASLELVFHIAKEGRRLTGSLDSISQGIGGVPLSRVEYHRPNLQLAAETIGGVFDGSLDLDRSVISGTWRQGEINLPLELRQTDQPATLAQGMSTRDYAQRAGSAVQGLWHGTLMVEKVPLRLDFKVAEATDGSLRVQVDSVDQGAKNMPASSASYDDSMLEMEFASLNGKFRGRMTGQDDEIIGTWSQAGKQWPLTLKRGDPTKEAFRQSYIDYSHKHEGEVFGHWAGTLNVKGTQLRLIFNIGQLDNKTLAGSMISQDQGNVELPATSVQWAAPTVRMEWKAVGGTFEGTLADGRLKGSWRQGSASFPLELRRTAAD